MFLSHAEIIDLTKKRRFAAQVRALQAMGIPIRSIRQDNSPVVLKVHVEGAHSGGSRPEVRDP